MPTYYLFCINISRVFFAYTIHLLPPCRGSEKELHLHFLAAAKEFVGRGGGAVDAVLLERTHLVPGPAPTSPRKTVGTGETYDLPAQLVLESIGYISLPMDGAAFDYKAGVVPNQLGQAYAMDGAIDPGLFVCGWLKRGPTGIIGTNLVDAEQTVDTMVRAAGTFPAVHAAAAAGGEGLRALLASRGHRAVSYAGWQRIDAEEMRRGHAVGKPREKLTSVEEMLAVAGDD